MSTCVDLWFPSCRITSGTCKHICFVVVVAVVIVGVFVVLFFTVVADVVIAAAGHRVFVGLPWPGLSLSSSLM